jgi:hypothetical protein
MWTLHKGTQTAACVVWPHLVGWELRLMVGAEVLQSQVCRSDDDLLTTQDHWHTAMREKGWQEQHPT